MTPKKLQKDLPGHLWLLQVTFFVSVKPRVPFSIKHSSPFGRGSGLVHSLFSICVPPPHDSVQTVTFFHSDQLPAAKNKMIKKR